MTRHLPSLSESPRGFQRVVSRFEEVCRRAPFIGDGATVEKGIEYAHGIADYSIRLAASDDMSRPHLMRTSGVVSHMDPASPDAVFRRNGLDNPDNDYLICSLDADHEYVVSGVRGSTCELNLQLLDGNYSDRVDAFAMNKGILPSRDLPVRADGTFEVMLTRRASSSADVLTMPADTRAIIVRQSYANWGDEAAGAVRVQRVGDTSPDDVLIDEAFWLRATTYFENTMSVWLQFGPGVSALVAPASGPKSLPYNAVRLPRRTPGGFPDQFSMSARFLVRDNEEVVITMQPSGAAYHAVQLGDYWFTSLPYVHKQSSLNAAQYRTSPDGSVSVVISKTDPGVHNWLDTCGLGEGYVFLRWQGLPDGVEPPEPTIEVISAGQSLQRGLGGGSVDTAHGVAIERDMTSRVVAFARRELAARRADWA